MTDSQPRTLGTVETNCRVIDALQDANGATVTELADSLNLSPGGLYNHLATLVQEEYVVKHDGKYWLSLQFLTRGRGVLNNNILYKAGSEVTEQLAEDTGEFSHLMAVEYGRGIYLQKSKGDAGISPDYNRMKMATRDYLHWSSSGKAYLAHIPESEVRDIVDHVGLPAMNENTVTDVDALFAELGDIRERGYAINDGEEISGTRAIGAPIETDHEIYGAISISGPASRFTPEKIKEELSQRVIEAANIISVNIKTIQNQ